MSPFRRPGLAPTRLLGLTAALLATAGVGGPVGGLVWASLDQEESVEAETWAGGIPSASGSVQHLTLTLFPNATFRLRRARPGAEDGAERDSYELGRWVRDGSGRLTLRSGTREPHSFRLTDADTLHVLDAAGHEIGSDSPAGLVRQPTVDPVAGPMGLRGMYSYLADAATLDECFTGQRYPVAFEGAQAETERAYLEVQPSAGAPVLVSLRGRFEERQREEGPKTEHLVIEELDRFWPGETCAREAMATAELRNTYWRPVEIEGQPVRVEEGQREPHLLLQTADDRVRGFTGCNSLNGAFEHGESSLRLGPLAVTRRACPPAVAQLETRFLQALEATASYQIVGNALDLHDSEGALRIRLEARYLD